jgi:hypothetical protein
MLWALSNLGGILHILVILLAALLIVVSIKKVSANPDLDSYYPPEIDIDDEYYSISILVEIDEKNGKKAFVKLFEKYGFSGNGPSIEQVIRKNTSFQDVEFNSEGDAFLMYARDKAHQAQIVNELKCIQDIQCLDKWLKKASWILLKE